MSTLRNIFKLPELRNKLLFTLLMIGLYRLGTHIPVPGIDVQQLRLLKQQASGSGGVASFLNLFSGGALTQFSIFVLGIMPYITSSIIMQLLTVVIPRLEQWSKDGAVGQKKITQWTRYLTIFLALIQATGYTFIFHNGGRGIFGSSDGSSDFDLYPGGFWNLPRVTLGILTIVAGTALVMWMGELISQRGIGNGMSILIFTNVVSRLPAEGSRIRDEKGTITLLVVAAIVLGMIVAIIIVDNGQRRIPVQFPKRVIGNRMMGGSNTYIPLKVNQSGVVPIIFASSVLYFPALIQGVLPKFASNFVRDYLLQPDNMVYIVLYGTLIMFFAYFYTAISFDPHQQSDQIRKQGGFIPGIRPGAPTERHLNYILNRITLPGGVFIMLIALVPSLLLLVFNISNFGFAGTSILIAVGVALETMRQIDSQMTTKNYAGFLKPAKAAS